jgi:tetratricopeptide (TPR) repeat protein
MSEISKDEELINQNAKTKTIITQYLQDIYRFYKLFGQKQYFYDVFNTDLDLYNASFFKLLIQNPGVLRNIGEFYFEKDYYEDAVQVFSRLAMENENDRELLEKLAYSYQRLKKYPQAIEVYHKVELFDENRAWTLKNLALCYKRNKAEDKAIEYYKQAEAFEPDNLYIQAYLGHCYLDIMDYETALQYYFKVEYLAPSNSRIMRPIAWCSFILGKFETAQKYYNKLFEKGKGNMHDYLNYGHVEWCMGNPQNALEAYKSSINQKGASKDSFEKEYLGDKDYLLQHGINEIDIYLMLDQIKMV